MPHFAVHEGYAVYEGPATDSSFHMHAAFQVAIAVRGEVLMVDASGTRHQAVALIVPPMVRHRMLAVPHLLTFFVEPQCAFADRLRERCGPGVTADPELRDLREEDVRSATGRPAEGLDGRLLAAMNALADQRVPMPVLSAQVGLSPQRLRALARQQLGMPLPRWRIWQRLARATEALREGRSLADAATTAGFADQAHFNRQMREMLGLAPSFLLPGPRRPAEGPSGAARGMGGDGSADR
ncbi:AraC family transcriptional regulator [Streptomyces cinnamoneus]|uniref:AraC family transcriptional regulator n=1 Tax=Streptomyces cinnamoneus TaxID=53446 RepID=UPI00195F250E|nr:AraC family transcriptional regulator [Streptomyces cinnamoneus]